MNSRRTHFKKILNQKMNFNLCDVEEDCEKAKNDKSKGEEDSEVVTFCMKSATEQQRFGVPRTVIQRQRIEHIQKKDLDYYNQTPGPKGWRV